MTKLLFPQRKWFRRGVQLYRTTATKEAKINIISENVSSTWQKPLDISVRYCEAVCMHDKLLQLCLNLCNLMYCSPLGSFVHRILQAEYWSALPCPPPGYLPSPGIKPNSQVSCIGRQVLYLQHHLGSPIVKLIPS